MLWVLDPQKWYKSSTAKMHIPFLTITFSFAAWIYVDMLGKANPKHKWAPWTFNIEHSTCIERSKSKSFSAIYQLDYMS